ncbi:hypothetical protein ALC60_09163 [Trachymyrmex zeteki]|uniref:Uncharacterized protein n=1 Tax=Mycetomoellerius zeteki TaxID=64791 RepID=A0A151WUX5_9HYME|nr:hypothetical protein ALC60_09163 [Trachymyrmex zeteki]
MAFVTFQAACHSLILTPAPNSPPPSSYSLNSPLLMLPVLILSLQLEKSTHGDVSLPISLVTEGVLGDPHVVRISICLIPVHGHHLSVIMTFIEGFELTLTGSALRMVLAHATGTATTNQLHTRTVLWPYGLQSLPGDVDRCTKGRYIKSTEICHFSLTTATRMQAKLHEEVKIVTNTSTAASTSSGNVVFKESEGSRG